METFSLRDPCCLQLDVSPWKVVQTIYLAWFVQFVGACTEDLVDRLIHHFQTVNLLNELSVISLLCTQVYFWWWRLEVSLTNITWPCMKIFIFDMIAHHCKVFNSFFWNRASWPYRSTVHPDRHLSAPFFWSGPHPIICPYLSSQASRDNE